MLEKHNKYLTISLGGLTLVSILLFFFSRKESRPEIDRDYFRVTDSEKIDHISLKSNRGVVDLMFDGTRWKVNSKWKLRSQCLPQELSENQ